MRLSGDKTVETWEPIRREYKDMKSIIEREPHTRFENLYRGYLEIDGKIFFLGKVITTSDKAAREYFEKAKGLLLKADRGNVETTMREV